jgi:hypothetical protein
MRVYEAIVRGLESVGVEAAFGGAGENAAGMMVALKHSEKIRGIIARHEQAASFMACGYAMFSNKLGVCWQLPDRALMFRDRSRVSNGADARDLGLTSLNWHEGSLKDLGSQPRNLSHVPATTKRAGC